MDIAYTPKDLNIFIKDKKLYFGTDYPGEESKIYTEKVLDLLNLKLTRDIPYLSYIEKENIWYFLKVLMEGDSHFINVIKKINGKFLCFDPWDGKLKFYSVHNIVEIRRVEKI